MTQIADPVDARDVYYGEFASATTWSRARSRFFCHCWQHAKISQRMIMEDSKVRRRFWQRYLELYPEDAELGVKISGAPTQWLRESDAHDFNVAIYRAKDQIGVFLRGVRGVSAEELQERLAPHATRFAELAGNVNHLGSLSNHPGDAFDLCTVNEGNWDQAINWLHDRGHAFLGAAVEVFESEK